MVILEKIKQHPYVAAGFLGAVLLLLFVVSRRSGSSTTSASSGIDPTTASLYAQNQQLTAQSTMQANALDAAAAHDTTLANYGLALATIQNNAATTQSNTQASVQMAGIAANADVQKQGIAATLEGLRIQGDTANLGIMANLEGLRSNNNTTLGIAQIMAEEQTAIANTTAQTQLGVSNNWAQVQIAGVNAGVTTAGINAGAAKHASDNQLIGSAIGGLTSLAGAALMFSDDRIKDNVVLVGRRRGFNIYEFDFIGHAGRYRGVMAQEVRRTRPDAVNDNGGILSVDYGRLGLEMVRVA